MKPIVPPEHRAQILEELEAILESPAFRGSKRGQQLLRYVVENSVAEHWDLLKERSIGVEVFGRDPSYETGEDSVVRVAAREVRQRLNQYRAALDSPRTVQIDIPRGSYLPTYSFFPAAPDLESQSRARPHWAWAGLPALLALILATGLAYTLWRRPAASALDRFWKPFTNGSSPVIISISSPEAYYVPPNVRERMGPNRRPDDIVRPEEITRLDAVNSLDANAAVSVSSFLGSKGKLIQFRNSVITSFSDLRGAPTIMIGAYNNQWTMQMTGELHFVYANTRGKDWSIVEQAAPRRRWTIPDIAVRTEPLDRDYGLVSRIFDRQTGQPFIALGGLEAPATAAAAECLVSAQCLAAAVRNAPPDWERKNLQFVISARIISGSPAAPAVEATYCW